MSVLSRLGWRKAKYENMIITERDLFVAALIVFGVLLCGIAFVMWLAETISL